MLERTLLALAFTGLLAVPLSGCLDGNDGGTPSTTPTGGTPGVNACASPGSAKASSFSPEKPRATLDIENFGKIVLELEREKAPITVGNFVNLSTSGFYDGTTFHRVIGPSKSPPDGFMMQGGDPNSKDDNPANDGQGGPATKIPDEFHPELRHSAAGVLSMANAGPNSGGSQFFITFTATAHLDDKHSVFGRVVEGMDVVRAVAQVKTGQSDRPVEPVKLTKVTIDTPAADASKREIAVGAHGVVTTKKTEAARPVTFMLVAENDGNARDALGVGATVPDGWSCKSDFASALVSPGTARVALVTLTPPAGASGETKIPLRAWSETDPTKAASFEVTVNVGPLGKEAKSGSKVQGNYAGLLEDGRLFDTSIESVAKNPAMGKSAFWGTDAQHRFQTFDFTVGSGVITGFSELATGAKEGETKAGRMPPAKAYGTSGGELSGKTLLFELEIVKLT